MSNFLVMDKYAVILFRKIVFKISDNPEKTINICRNYYRRLKDAILKSYLNLFFQIARLISLLPFDCHTQNTLAYKLGRAFTPFRRLRPNLLSAFQTALGVDSSEAKQILRQWEASKGLATVEIFRYAQINRKWVDRHIKVDKPEILSKILQKGGLILSYHTFHQDTLFTILGQFGIKVTGISLPAKDMPYAHHIGRYQRFRLITSEKVSGGQHIYIGRRYETVKNLNIKKTMKDTFAKGEAVLAACDTHHIDSSFPSIEFLNSSIRIKTGVLKWAQEAGAPVYFAIFYPNFAGGYNLFLKSIGPLTDIQQCAKAYFSFLENHLLKAPWVWQGWWWYPTMIDPKFSLSFFYKTDVIKRYLEVRSQNGKIVR